MSSTTPIHRTLKTIGAIQDPDLLQCFRDLADAATPAEMLTIVSAYATAATGGSTIDAVLAEALDANAGGPVEATLVAGRYAIAKVVDETILEADLQTALDTLDTELAAALP